MNHVVFGFSSLLIVHAVCLQCSSHSACNVEARRLQDIELTITSSDYRPQTADGTQSQQKCTVDASSAIFPTLSYFICEMKKLCSNIKEDLQPAERLNKVLNAAPSFYVIMSCSKLCVEMKKWQTSRKEADNYYCNQ